MSSHETISATVDNPAKTLEIIRGLPPEERDKVQVKEDHLTGSAEIVQKVQDLLIHDRSTGTSGD